MILILAHLRFSKLYPTGAMPWFSVRSRVSSMLLIPMITAACCGKAALDTVAPWEEFNGEAPPTIAAPIFLFPITTTKILSPAEGCLP